MMITSIDNRIYGSQITKTVMWLLSSLTSCNGFRSTECRRLFPGEMSVYKSACGTSTEYCQIHAESTSLWIGDPSERPKDFEPLYHSTSTEKSPVSQVSGETPTLSGDINVISPEIVRSGVYEVQAIQANTPTAKTPAYVRIGCFLMTAISRLQGEGVIQRSSYAIEVSND